MGLEKEKGNKQPKLTVELSLTREEADRWQAALPAFWKLLQSEGAQLVLTTLLRFLKGPDDLGSNLLEKEKANPANAALGILYVL